MEDCAQAASQMPYWELLHCSLLDEEQETDMM